VSSVPESANAKYDLDVPRRPRFVTMFLFAVIALFLLAGTTTAEVFTNSFLVKMRQPTERHVADQVALKNGFVNLGPVSDGVRSNSFGNSQFARDRCCGKNEDDKSIDRFIVE